MITGHLAVRQVKMNPATQKGAGLGLAGLIMGYLSIAALIVSIPVLRPTISGAIAGGKATLAVTDERQIFLDRRQSRILAGRCRALPAAWPSVHTLVDQKWAWTRSRCRSSTSKISNLENVNRSDSGKTIFARTRPGTFTNGWVAVFYKDGTGQIFHSEAAVEGTPPAREPASSGPISPFVQKSVSTLSLLLSPHP